MLQAGLTTQSNGAPLSSGGMIFINAVGENTVKITQKISIATPTPFIEKNMQLFKGEVNNDSTINWTNPQPLPENPQAKALEKGSVLFQNNCASCHALGKDLTGPDLAHVMKRYEPYYYEGSGLSHPYAFTENPARVMAHDGYYRCLKNRFGGVVMAAFPALTRTDLDNLYGWIENESDRRNLPVPDNGLMQCRDSCLLYNQVTTKWKKIKSALEKDSSELQEDIRYMPMPQTASPAPASSWQDLNMVSPGNNRSLYYQFSIESFGWYNVDILMKDYSNCTPSQLMVRVQGQYKERFTVYLIIPSIKALIPGGPLKDQKDAYGFYTTDGSIPLPQNTKAFIIAMGEREDQIIFTKKEFITQQKQEFELQLTTITKEVLQQQIAAMQLSDVTIKVDDTKNAAELRNAIKELKNAEGLKPKNCDCDCFLDENYSDSSSKENHYSMSAK